MTERERLTELIMNTPKIPVIMNGRAQGRTYQTVRNIADHLLANGVIVPPCKVGETVYFIYRGEVTQGTVRLIRPFASEQETIFKGNIICEVDNLFIDDGTKEEHEIYVVFEKHYGIERVAYLTREEAEKVLEESKTRSKL